MKEAIVENDMRSSGADDDIVAQCPGSGFESKDFAFQAESLT